MSLLGRMKMHVALEKLRLKAPFRISGYTFTDVPVVVVTLSSGEYSGRGEAAGVYYLGDRWHEVRAGDFIWMGPYCPQSFYATSSSPARYIYYKNVNRDVEL